MHVSMYPCMHVRSNTLSNEMKHKLIHLLIIYGADMALKDSTGRESCTPQDAAAALAAAAGESAAGSGRPLAPQTYETLAKGRKVEV